eukprot:TRINITY_DN4882_c0_g1_i1.p1 TRINITY_DN4882_c0_g1~~TRINITY_DN4882_c0_g1_i1.p1  ORF type:complete len:338 (+),score=63.29 TRINITY_DN4882_c0_g1_i1:12-1025(+)
MDVEQQEQRKIDEVQEKLANYPSLSRPFRRLLFEGPLNLLVPSEAEEEAEEEETPLEFYFFLFNDIVLYARQSDDFPDKYEFVGQMQIRDLDVTSDKASELVFQIHVRSVDTSYRLQTATPEDREEWLSHIRAAIQNAMVHRVFGLSLDKHMSTEPETGRQIPFFMEKCFEFVEKHGVDKEGIFRASGSRVEQLNQMESINQGYGITLDDKTDPHMVASLLKAYVRELPEPLPTFDLVESFSQCCGSTDENERIEEIRSVVNQFPPLNRALFIRLMKCLAKVALNEPTNKMSAQNLSIVIAPSLIRSPTETNYPKTGFEPITFTIKNFFKIYPEESE